MNYDFHVCSYNNSTELIFYEINITLYLKSKNDGLEAGMTQNTSHLFSLDTKIIQCYILNPYWDYFLTNSKGGSNVYHKNTLVLI